MTDTESERDARSEQDDTDRNNQMCGCMFLVTVALLVIAVVAAMAKGW